MTGFATAASVVLIALLASTPLPAPDQRGTAHHLCLEVVDIDKTKSILEQRAPKVGYSRPMEIRTGVNRKRQLNLYDPDGTRVEWMEPNTVARPALDGAGPSSSSRHPCLGGRAPQVRNPRPARCGNAPCPTRAAQRRR